jgi:hypothetical protein
MGTWSSATKETHFRTVDDWSMRSWLAVLYAAFAVSRIAARLRVLDSASPMIGAR